MPTMPRDDNRNRDWNLWKEQGKSYDIERITAAVLMDIRDELRRLNELLHCSNFTGIPRTLKTISRKIPTRKPRKRT